MKLIDTFLYFAVFKYPLTEKEAHIFCQYKTPSIDRTLKALVEQKALHKIQDFYLPYNNPGWVARRIRGNELAKKKMIKAARMARIINLFPFVRSVMISGSLAKGYMDANSDIDFFLIMKPGNIAISKIMMGTFRRLFAPRSFCINFIIDSDHLDIRSKNIYSAVEMVTLIPMINAELYNRFMERNLVWIHEYLPNYHFGPSALPKAPSNVVKKAAEWVLSLGWAKTLNKRITRFYKRMHQSKNPNYKQSLESGELVVEKGVLKFHNGSYEQKILNLYESHKSHFVLQKETTLNEYFSK